MTTFYCFPDQTKFTELGGRTESEYVADSVNVSVLGPHYAPLPEPIEPVEGEEPTPLPEPELLGFLVNTSAPVSTWAEFETWPISPMRIFG